MTGPRCIECGKTAELATGERIYPHRRDLWGRYFWQCECGAYCGCHKGTTDPLGYPCGVVTRRARSAAHEAFDMIWRRGAVTRSQAYQWLAKAMGLHKDECHIGMMTAEQARQVVVEVNKLPQHPTIIDMKDAA